MEKQTFDYSEYQISEKEVKKFVESVFKDKEIKNKTILDAGCRLGEYSNYLAKKGAKSVIGIDISKKSIERAKLLNKSKKIKFHAEDIRNLSRLKDSTFDIVFCIGTMPYIPPKEIPKVLKEFTRVTKSNGTVLVLFQKPKGIIGSTARFTANILPLKIWMSIADTFSPVLAPLASLILKRKISREYLKYGIFLSLRGVYFGIPVKIPGKFKIQTPSCENYSEETTISYKIKILK